VAGFKYFELLGLKSISVTLRGQGEGRMQISTTRDFLEIAAEIPVCVNGLTKSLDVACSLQNGVYPLYFRYTGTGYVDFLWFTLR
jgi:hypothetical protein